MNLQSVKVSACYESETNPRGSEFEGVQFDELVASVKEKGVLVPVLVRPRPKAGKQFEVVAGNRRFRAAQKAGLAEIPAQVKEMSDDEAREAQIVENLQRADVHPLEEGEAYRKLIEDGGRKVADVAVKVGKSESYVRQRLFLTNLAAPLAKAYRGGRLPDSFAAVIARLSEPDQVTTFKHIKNAYSGVDLAYLKRYITQRFHHPLAFQPWVTNEAIAAVVGPCKECPPVREALFGTVKPGQCTDLKCWQRKMDAYIAYRRKENPDLLLVSKEYGETSKGILSRSEYEGLPTNKKKHCDLAQQAIVAEGPDTGSVIWVCADEKCEKHHYQHREYRPSKEERAKRRKELARLRAKEAKQYADFVDLIKKKVKWPLTEKALAVLIEKALHHHGFTSLMPVARRLELKSVKEKTSWGGVGNSFKPPLREWIKSASKQERLQLYFELTIDRDWVKKL